MQPKVIMKKCLSCTTSTSPPLSPYQASTSSLPARRRNVSAPFTGNRVCATVCCFRCHKPRCLYSPRQLSSRESRLLNDSIEQSVFTCGSAILSPTDLLSDRVSLKIPLTCDDPVETAVYTSKTGLNNVCHHCGKNEAHADAGTEQSKSQKSFILILPVCKECEMFGVEPRMLIPLSLPKRWAKDEDSSSLSSLSLPSYSIFNLLMHLWKNSQRNVSILFVFGSSDNILI